MNTQSLHENLFHRKIHESAIQAAQDFKSAEAALVEALIAVERERVFETLGFSSLFAYATSLGLSEAVAYNAITVARKAREIPELRAEIQSGSLSVSKAKKIAAVLTPGNHTEWLEKAKTLPSRELEREVARENPKAAVPERAKYINSQRLSLTLGVEDSLMQKLRRAQDQVSQSKNSAASLEETLSELVTFYLRHKDPVEKAARVMAKKEGTPARKEMTARETHRAGYRPQVEHEPQDHELVTGPVEAPPGNHPRTSATTSTSTSSRRTRLPAKVAHPVRLRDQGQCQEPGCTNRRWVDFHHIIPIHAGGENTVENLVTLCRVHHRKAHR